MEELALVADRITILRDGKRVYTGRYDSIDSGGIIRHMVGREIRELYPALPAPRPDVALEARGLSGGQYRNISFDLHRGEILASPAWWAPAVPLWRAASSASIRSPAGAC